MTLNFLERAGALRIEGTVLRSVRVTRTQGSEPASADDEQVLLAIPEGGFDVGTLARSMELEHRRLEGILFDLSRRRLISLADETTGVVVEMLPPFTEKVLESALTGAVEEHRHREKQREASAAHAVRAMARSVTCRVEHIASAYDYPSPSPGCGRCDRCDRMAPESAIVLPEETMEESVLRHVGALAAWYNELVRPALVATKVAEGLIDQLDKQRDAVLHTAESRPRVEVAFLGPTTVGKSTTMNALLEERLLPENSIGSTTAAQIVIRHGSRRRLLVKYHDQGFIEERMSRLRQEWRELAEEAEALGEGLDTKKLGAPLTRARSLYLHASNHALQLGDIEGPLPETVAALLGTTQEFEG